MDVKQYEMLSIPYRGLVYGRAVAETEWVDEVHLGDNHIYPIGYSYTTSNEQWDKETENWQERHCEICKDKSMAIVATLVNIEYADKSYKTKLRLIWEHTVYELVDKQQNYYAKPEEVSA